jgi:acyl-coenzyme A synthetase/AMP-(fatty) acid ligase
MDHSFNCPYLHGKPIIHQISCFYNFSILVSIFIGVKKGDRVAIYMPMIVELVVAMLACARIGAVHSIVVSFFMA